MSRGASAQQESQLRGLKRSEFRGRGSRQSEHSREAASFSTGGLRTVEEGPGVLCTGERAQKCGFCPRMC